MDTREAFEKMISVRGVHNQLGTYSGHVTQLRAAFKKGTVTLDKMEELLAKAGWKKVVVEEWYSKEQLDNIGEAGKKGAAAGSILREYILSGAGKEQLK